MLSRNGVRKLDPTQVDHRIESGYYTKQATDQKDGVDWTKLEAKNVSMKIMQERAGSGLTRCTRDGKLSFLCQRAAT